jgi:hypothetical protein
MTTVEAPIATGQIEAQGSPQPDNSGSISPAEYTQCASYKEAKYLAASRRRDGLPSYAVLVRALDRWCVRDSTAPQRYQ